jgi:hypothetical protein
LRFHPFLFVVVSGKFPLNNLLGDCNDGSHTRQTRRLSA